jgi:hypothetical protein
MKTCFTSVVSSDHFQNYIPMYCLALRTWYKGDIIIYLRGEPTKEVIATTKSIPGLTVNCSFFKEYPNNTSTTNCLRFIHEDPIINSYDYSLITDIDMLIMQDPWQWHFNNATPAHPFSGYHGAITKPVRKEICKVWTGQFERVAGGFFCVTPDWFDSTRASRTKFGLALMDGRCGTYRENDEVMLAQIIKESGFPVPPTKHYPRELRGLHLGDFKFEYRWKKLTKMLNFLTERNVVLYGELSKTSKWKETIKILNNPMIDELLKRVDTHIKVRLGLQ